MRATGVKIEQLKEHRAEALESRFAIAEKRPVAWPAGTGTPAAGSDASASSAGPHGPAQTAHFPVTPAAAGDGRAFPGTL